MPKRVISFKPTPECESQIAELMDRWKCDRTACLVKAVGIAHLAQGLRDGHVEPEPMEREETWGQKVARVERSAEAQEVPAKSVRIRPSKKKLDIPALKGSVAAGSGGIKRVQSIPKPEWKK